MHYTHRVTITIPATLYAVACAIARSLDPDVGGAGSFGSLLQGDPPSVPAQYTTSTRCSAAFAQNAAYMAANPDALHAFVLADYERRWPDLTPPTLADCTAFCAGLTMTAHSVDEP